MATNSVTTTKNGYTLTLTATERAYDAVGNTSVVAIELKLTANGTYFQQYLCNGVLSVGGVAVKTYSDYYSLSGRYDSVVLASYEGVFNHDASGKLTLSISGTFGGPSGGAYTPGSGSVSLNLVCTTLPRASQIVSIGGNLEEGITLGVSDSLSNPTKNLRFMIGGVSFATRDGFDKGKVMFSGGELLKAYRAAGVARNALVTVSLETVGVGSCVKTLSVPLSGNLRQRRDGGFERGRLFIYQGGWQSAVIYAYASGWRRGL